MKQNAVSVVLTVTVAFKNHSFILRKPDLYFPLHIYEMDNSIIIFSVVFTNLKS